jgi:uncharacterized membrane protein YphA (DoxX/SURF4 family)
MIFDIKIFFGFPAKLPPSLCSLSIGMMGSSTPVRVRGWRAALGSTEESLALYRITLGALLLAELVMRFRYLHPFYSDEGTLPLRFLRPKVDVIYHVVCIHCWSGSIRYQQILLSIQVLCAFCLMIGYQARVMAILSWFLYLSSTLRNTWLAFILDRYFHYLLFYAMFLPLDGCWSIKAPHRSHRKAYAMIVSMATVALKLQVVWIYLDAGAGKLMDPLGGWTYHADPLPALDTYARHTIGARYLYALLTPAGLRLLTPMVVYVELLSAPLALLASYMGNDTLVYTAIGLICSLHIGIAITLRNTILLSLIACCPCFIFLPIRWNRATTEVKIQKQKWFSVSSILILALFGGSMWFELLAVSCDQSVKHIWSTLLHNRWNVFVGAEEYVNVCVCVFRRFVCFMDWCPHISFIHMYCRYVTWEIAPGRLVDGSIVDVWGKADTVDWRLPGTGAPCTSTSRPGRWRSFPYLAGIAGEEGDVLWGYLCKEWDLENKVAEKNPSRQLVEFNFFMLQADVLPNMGFSATRKRLIHSFKCVESDDNSREEKSESENDKGSSDTVSNNRLNDEAEL